MGWNVVQRQVNNISHFIYDESKLQIWKTKIYKIGIRSFSIKHEALRSKNKDWLVLNQNNSVSEWSDMSSCGLLF